jgi:hypothetical protein
MTWCGGRLVSAGEAIRQDLVDGSRTPFLRRGSEYYASTYEEK